MGMERNGLYCAFLILLFQCYFIILNVSKRKETFTRNKYKRINALFYIKILKPKVVDKHESCSMLTVDVAQYNILLDYLTANCIVSKISSNIKTILINVWEWYLELSWVFFFQMKFSWSPFSQVCKNYIGMLLISETLTRIFTTVV